MLTSRSYVSTSSRSAFHPYITVCVCRGRMGSYGTGVLLAHAGGLVCCHARSTSFVNGCAVQFMDSWAVRLRAVRCDRPCRPRVRANCCDRCLIRHVEANSTPACGKPWEYLTRWLACLAQCGCGRIKAVGVRAVRATADPSVGIRPQKSRCATTSSRHGLEYSARNITSPGIFSAPRPSRWKVQTSRTAPAPAPASAPAPVPASARAVSEVLTPHHRTSRPSQT